MLTRGFHNHRLVPLRTLLALCLLCPTAASAFAETVDDGATGGHVMEIAAMLASHDFEQRQPVRTRGVVTLRLGEGLVIQDDRAGIWIEVTQSRRMNLLSTDLAEVARLREGDLVEVVGKGNRGAYAPNLLPVSVRKVGESPLPPARPYDRNRFFHGRDDCMRVEVEAIVQGIRDDADNDRWLFLAEDATKRFLIAVAKRAVSVPPDALIDTSIRCVGVATAEFNSRGDLLSPMVNVCRAEDLRVDVSAAEVREVTLGEVGRYPDLSHRIRTHGVVTHSSPGNLLYLQKGPVGVLVETTSPEQFVPGDIVEAVGFVTPAAPVSGLCEARVLRTGREPAPEPIAIQPTEIIRLNAQAMASYVTAEPGDYYGCLITFPATVVDVSPGRTGAEIRLLADGVGVTATTGLLGLVTGRSLEAGSRVQVTGIVRPPAVSPRKVSNDAMPADAPLEILLRNPTDLKLLRGPSWWKPHRLAAVIAALGAVVLGTLTWGLLLRRQVARQVAIIQDKLHFEAVAEERLRIAREFHDTLEQDLAGIALRLDAAADMTDDAASRAVLEQQRSLLEQVRQETHDFLWDLRDPTRTDGSLVESLAAQTAYLRSLTHVPITLHIDPDAGPLSPAAQFHLLRIVREAVTNALKHAAPSRVTLRVAATDAATTIEIADDGKGCDMAAASSLNGHFGLRGIMERATRMGATFTLDSDGGQGTTVRIAIPHEHGGHAGGESGTARKRWRLRPRARF